MPYFSPGTPRVLAHRGLATAVVENTLAAFAAASAAGARYVETDAHATADGVAVLVHDPEIRSAGRRHTIRDCSLARLRQIDLGGGAVVPTLSEALTAFPELRFNIDVKADDAPEAVAAAVLEARAGDRVLITSFDEGRRRRTLAALADAGLSTIATAASSPVVVRALFVSLLGSLRLAERLLDGVHAMQVPERRGPLRVVSPRFLRTMHRAGIEVHVWTVNDPADMERLLDLGVDGIVTDRCDLAVQVAARREG